MFLRTIGIISRIHISNILKALEIAKEEIPVVKVMDYDNCPNSCMLKNTYDYLKCKTGCDKYTLKLVNNESLMVPCIIENEYKTNIIHNNKVEKKLSRSQILQYICYHFLPLTKNGTYKYLLEKDVAEFINCSIKTVKRNNEILKLLGLIDYTYEDAGIISIEIINYANSFKSKSEKGKGGIRIPLNAFRKIIELKTIDELRFSLFMFERYISTSSQYEDYDMCDMIVKNFKALVVKGKKYSKKIYGIISNLKDLFNLNITENKIISFNLIPCFKPEIYELDFTKECESVILDKLDEKNINTDYKDVDSLISLAKQYGKEAVLHAIHSYKKPKRKINLGGYIRNIINQTYLQKIGIEI